MFVDVTEKMWEEEPESAGAYMLESMRTHMGGCVRASGRVYMLR